MTPLDRWGAIIKLIRSFPPQNFLLPIKSNCVKTTAMAKVAYVNPEPDVKDRFTAAFTPVYKTKYSSLRWNGRLIPPRKKKNISTRSLLPQIRDIWNGLSPEIREQWKLAAAEANYNGWNQFVQDMAYRIKFEIAGTATPSIYHTYKVGRIDMEAPATNFRLEQLHPVQYFQMRKVRGTKSQREPVAITEQLLLPLEVAASYRTDLTATGPEPYAKFYAEVTRSYQGTDQTEEVGFTIPLSSPWARQSATLTEVAGTARWYSLYIELNDVAGFLEFDLVRAFHTGTNFARDFRCTNISSGFSNFNYQLPASWAADSAEEGVSFGSVYPSDS